MNTEGSPAMATATATDRPAPTREILQDRWDAVMDWERNGGNATEEYMNLAEALRALALKVAGLPEQDVIQIPDDDFLFGVSDLVIIEVMRLGIAR